MNKKREEIIYFFLICSITVAALSLTSRETLSELCSFLIIL